MFSVHGATPRVCIKEPSSRGSAQAASLLLVLRWYQYTSGFRASFPSHISSANTTSTAVPFKSSLSIVLPSGVVEGTVGEKKGALLEQPSPVWWVVVARLSGLRVVPQESVQRNDVGYSTVNSCYGCFSAAPAGHHCRVCVRRV